MQVFHGRDYGKPSEQRGETFSGVVWADPVMPRADNVGIGHMFFAPGARTYWHSHADGQVLHVSAGRGWICVEGGNPQEIRQGDVVWIRPNERHWHGAAADTYMVHLAISMGTTDWKEEVSDPDYAQAGR